MPDYIRLYESGGTYFFTVVTCIRRPLLRSDSAVSILNGCFKRVMKLHPFTIEALVLLPDHLHTIWTLPSGDSDFSMRWNLIKGNFSRRLRPESDNPSVSREKHREKTVWQRRFWEHLLQQDFNRHCDYIHYNPVKHGLVRSPGDWVHSTFSEFVAKGLYSPDWGSEISTEITGLNLK
jgi:putative transposase